VESTEFTWFRWTPSGVCTIIWLGYQQNKLYLESTWNPQNPPGVHGVHLEKVGQGKVLIAVYVLLLLLVITFSHLLSVNDLEWTSLLLAHMFHPLMTCNGNYNNMSGHLKQYAFMCWFVYMSDDVFIWSSHTYDQTWLMFISLSYVSAFSLFLYVSMFYAWLIWSSWMLGDLYCQCHVFYALLPLIIIVDLCTCSMMSGCLIYVSCCDCLLIRRGVRIICPIIRYLYHVVFVSSSDQTNCSTGVVVGSNYILVIFLLSIAYCGVHLAVELSDQFFHIIFCPL